MIDLPILKKIINTHKATGKGGIVSVCSAHPEVLKAAVAEAKAQQAILLIESTSNQVDQFGGYMGLTPAQFIAQTRATILSEGFPEEKLFFGGDHLGPNTWQHLPAEEAMRHAETLIQEYAQAGYDKIHLDCSMSCADDPIPLDDATVAERAARLCLIAEKAKSKEIVYIIGTEVPIPGGAQEDLEENLTPTTTEAARQTLAIHQKIFFAHNLEAVWPRIIGLVVQPGVEFDHMQVIDYKRENAKELSQLAEEFTHAIFEAHSTDYQKASALKALVEDHFAILKVGPALSFAYREALYALYHALKTIDKTIENLPERIDHIMQENPKYWQKHYHGTEKELLLLRTYSLSDRIRYYWMQKESQNAVQQFITRYKQNTIPYGVLHQYLPQASEACREQGLALSAENLIQQHIRFVLRPYYQATQER